MDGKPGLRGKRGKRGKGLKGDTVTNLYFIASRHSFPKTNDLLVAYFYDVLRLCTECFQKLSISYGGVLL